MSEFEKPVLCTGCPLYDRPLVPSEKPGQKASSYLWIVGEAPGYTEVQKGRPFVGRAGSLLRQTLRHLGFSGPAVITNACLCHPENNRVPPVRAIQTCQYHLEKLKEQYPAAFIIALGATAARALGVPVSRMDSMRGKIYSTRYGRCLVTYHPARVLRTRYKLNSLFNIDLKKALYTLQNETNCQVESPDITVLTHEKEILQLLQSIPATTVKAIDVETSIPDEKGNWPDWGLNVHHPLNGIYSVAVAWDGKAYSFPVESKIPERTILYGSPGRVKKALKQALLQSENWVAHNCKFELQVFQHHLGVTPHFVHDTQILAYLMRETLQGFYNLKSLTEIYLPAWQDYKEIKRVDLLRYNALDAYYTLKLLDALSKELMRLPQKNHILRAEQFILKNITPLVAHVEQKGVLIDWQRLEEYRKYAEYTRSLVEQKIETLTGVSNPRTATFRKNLKDILTKHNLPVAETDTGMPSISEATLKELYSKAPDSEVKKLILYKLTHTKLDKIINSFLDRYPRFLNPFTGRIHPTYRIDGTVTGRLSSEKPNFQQIPREGILICPDCLILSQENCPICGKQPEEFVNISKLISAAEGYCLISADYSQMEVRILAHITEDENLCSIIRQGADLHSYTASRIYRIPYEEFVRNKDTSPELKRMRQHAKSATFGIIYGITAQGLALRTGTSVAEAQKLIDRFYQTYPKVGQWIKDIHEFVTKNRYVVSPTGRVRHFDSPQIEPNMLREAQNFPIQSYASDLTVAAAWKIAKTIQEFNASVVGLVHDSIKIEVPLMYMDTVQNIIKDIMTDWIVATYRIKVPLEVDMEISIPRAEDKKPSLKVEAVPAVQKNEKQVLLLF